MVKSTFNQSHVKKLSNGSGSWKVILYKPEHINLLSRFPLYTNLPFNERVNGKEANRYTTHAKISINNKE